MAEGADSGTAKPSDDAGGGGMYASVPSNWACLQQPVPDKPDGSVQIEFFMNSASGNSSAGGGDIGTPSPGGDGARVRLARRQLHDPHHFDSHDG